MSWDTYSFYYSDNYEVDLGENHRFPIEKYRALRDKLISDGIIMASQFIPAKLAPENLLKIAHSNDYIEQTLSYSLDSKRARRIGLPVNEAMVNRARASVDAFFNTSLSAIKDGFSATISGGTHHAQYNQGGGFCFFNDFAIASKYLLNQYPLFKILILDLDVHQGDGNSEILKDEDAVTVVSFHGKDNYPYNKYQSDIDMAFESHTGDDEYLSALEQTLANLSNDYNLIMYQAGVDSLIHDKLGLLDLTYEGLKKRDELVFRFAKINQIPLAMALGGGYSDPIDYSIQAYYNTYIQAKEIYP